MAGYDGYSQSNNALAAKSSGKYPLTQAVEIVAKETGVSKADARRVLIARGPCEWHHTSKKYNRTNFYNTVPAIRQIQRRPLLERFNAANGEKRISAALDMTLSLADRAVAADAVKAAIAAEIGTTADVVTEMYYEDYDDE